MASAPVGRRGPNGSTRFSRNCDSPTSTLASVLPNRCRWRHAPTSRPADRPGWGPSLRSTAGHGPMGRRMGSDGAAVGTQGPASSSAPAARRSPRAAAYCVRHARTGKRGTAPSRRCICASSPSIEAAGTTNSRSAASATSTSRFRRCRRTSSPYAATSGARHGTACRTMPWKTCSRSSKARRHRDEGSARRP
jgi:hypothetical protein